MWIELIKGLEPAAEFQPRASDEAIRACEESLGNRLHPDLAALLRETNGVHGEYGLGLIWPVERIAADNTEMRTSFADIYMPFDPLLFFADAGNGDQFAFVVQPPGRDEVFAWDHEDDSRQCVALGLSEYLTGWLTGRISV
jgi:hypothetical protein